MGYGYYAADALLNVNFFGTILLFYLLFFGGVIALYVMQSVGLYKLAQRRCIKNPWLSWLPIGYMWIIGSLADQYQYVALGRVRNRRKVILGLSIALLTLGTLIYITLFQMVGDMILTLPAIDHMSEQEQIAMIIEPLLTMLGILALMWVVAIVLAVFEYIALYNLYASSDPANKALYLVLGILFPILTAVFVFVCRNRDYGMPARRCDVQPPRMEQSQAQQ